MVVFDGESYTCDSIILWSGFGRKVLSVALGLSLSHRRGEPSTAQKEKIMRTLIIVESPAKARTLGNFLSKDYTVKASVGHRRDLPPLPGGL